MANSTTEPELDKIRKQFTGYERDIETDLDYAQARYYSPKLGRFYSVDPENFQAFQNIENPQSWNAYSYVNNNPCSDNDPTGLSCGWCQKLKNLVSGYGWKSNEEVEQITQNNLAFLQEIVAQSGGSITSTSWWTGSQFVLDSNSVANLSRSEIWFYANDLRSAMEDGRLTAQGEFPEVIVPDIDVPIPAPASPTVQGAAVVSKSQAKALKKIRNNINNHLTEKDLQALIRDVSRNPLTKSRGDVWQHYKEVTNAVRGLKKGVKSLEKALNNPNLAPSVRAEMQQAVQEARSYISRVEAIVRSH